MYRSAYLIHEYLGADDIVNSQQSLNDSNWREHIILIAYAWEGARSAGGDGGGRRTGSRAGPGLSVNNWTYYCTTERLCFGWH